MGRRTAQRWLFSLERFGMKLGLDAVSALLTRLDQPGQNLPAVLVAGTNGKGSTAAMTAAILTAAGVRTLLYTSPHVVSVRERIAVDGRLIPAAALERHLHTVRRAILALRRQGRLPHHPTFFEVLTAAALVHARSRRAAALVLEVGLGGRYDATNVIPAQVAVITNIERDHEHQLGRHLASIAWNKAGIIRDGATVLTATSDAQALGVIREIARRRNARLRRVPRAAASLRADGRWDLSLGRRRWAAGLGLPATLTAVRLGLAGTAQGTNATLAAAAAAALFPQVGPGRLGRKALRAGLGAVRLPGRHERRQARGGRQVLLDAAHNPAACHVLAGEVRAGLGNRSVTLLLGIMRDKNAAAMGRSLFPLAERVILCRPRHHRARDPRSLRALVPRGIAARIIPDPDEAWNEALRATPPGDLILVTGSFYLLGDLSARTGRLPRLP